MSEPSYTFKLSRFTACTTYRLTPDALCWNDGRREGQLALGAIDKVEISQVRFWGSSRKYWCCVLHSGSRRIRLQAAHWAGFRRYEDRSDSYIPFIKQLEARIAAAFPDKSKAEIDAILAGMWDNLGRILAEYAHLDRFWDYDPEMAQPGRIVLDPENRARFARRCAHQGPMLTFGGHLANWELLVWSSGARQGEAAIVYRPPAIEPLARELSAIRADSGTTLIPADAGTLFRIKALIERGGEIGMLVDEHFARGIEAMFFGRPCLVNPLFANLARHYECPLYGTRVVRLSDGRYRYLIEDPIDPPRDATGRIDEQATMQMITGIIEGWIREHPEQWIWMQRRWR
jgi:Kdo2-lipid IVA lauroyltransferase/acyltransferase